MIYRVVPFSVTLNDPQPGFLGRDYSTLNISETVQDKHMVTTEC